MVTAKAKPKVKSLVKYNIVIYVLVILTFASTAFLKCDQKVESEYEGIVSRPYCNSHCYCSLTDFQPICLRNKTYFSPCFAGCSSIKEINSEKIYQNCTCGGGWYEKRNFESTEGTCNSAKCNLLWALSQANGVISSALLASTMVTNLVINMRCVRNTDKALALGLEYTFLGLVPFLPVKLVYGAIADKFCDYHSNGVCGLYSESLGLFLSSSTIVLMTVSVMLAIAVVYLINFKYDAKEMSVDDEEPPQELVEVNQDRIEENSTLINNNERRPNNEPSEDELDLGLAYRRDSRNSGLSGDSLLELENVGDDHDSVASLSHDTTNRRRYLDR